jgi:hypothetical protein
LRPVFLTIVIAFNLFVAFVAFPFFLALSIVHLEAALMLPGPLLQIILSYGLLKGKHWAWWVTVLVSVLAGVSAIAGAVMSFRGGDPEEAIGFSLYSIFIIIWLLYLYSRGVRFFCSVRSKTTAESKLFMTAGPTLHYTHRNVISCWLLAVAVYVVACVFWSRIFAGSILEMGLPPDLSFNPHALGLSLVKGPISIYVYPWQILVIGLLMAIMGTAPVLVAQLLSFRYSLPLIIVVLVIAKLPILAAVLLLSCVAVSCRPLRFRSRFISIVLCTTPQLGYWAACGKVPGFAHDYLLLSFSFVPWLAAWLTGLAIAGTVLGIGHYTRYKPGLVFSVTGLVLAIGIFAFSNRIGFAELDYQLHVIGNDPEEIDEFRRRSMTDAIDKAIADPSTRSYLKGLFYPTEPILLREDLKSEIQNQLNYDRWPNWFVDVLPDEFKYQEKRQQLREQYDQFIDKWPEDNRVPIALYYKAMLQEYKPDIRELGISPDETLRFYNDYPHREALTVWYKLFKEFPDSRESLEARWRIAKHLAGQRGFDEAERLRADAQSRVENEIELLSESAGDEGGFWAHFVPPAKTIMTLPKLIDLKNRLAEFEVLISEQNRSDTGESRERLGRFVLLNPYRLNYAAELEILLSEMQPEDPLMDNVLVAKVMLITDSKLKASELKSLSDRFAGTDGGIAALYKLGLLKVTLQKDPHAKGEQQKYRAEARAILTSFIERYPRSIFSEQARIWLDSLPAPAGE